MAALLAQPTHYLTSIQAERARRHAEHARQHAEEVRENCKRLTGFVREAWSVVEPRAVYAHGFHIDAMCAHLEAVTYGQINRLLTTVPPGSSKSLLTSVLWPAWEWSQGFGAYRYLATSFNDKPVTRDTRKSRDLILSSWYQGLWPEVRLVRTGETSFANSQTGAREGVAFASLTSQRGDRLIIDDPHSTETAESDAERTRTTRMFREGALDRLNDLERSAIVVVMQRLHERDVAGTILSLPELGFEHLMIPMEFEPERRCMTSIGWSDPRTELDELMEPQRFPRVAVDKIKVGKGSYAYAGQYQQRPAPREGGMFKRSWFKIIDAVPAGLTLVRDWDLAGTVATPGKDPDWTAGCKIGRDAQGFYYIVDMRRFRGSPHEVESAILQTAHLDGHNCIVSLKQDPGQAGKAQAEALTRMLAGFVVKTATETGSKETRASPFAAQCEAGNVTLISGEWNNDFLDEIEVFPFGRHDDQVDAAASGFNQLAGSSEGARWLAMMDQVDQQRAVAQQQQG